MKINVSKIVGVANSKAWAQVHEFRPESKFSGSSTDSSPSIKVEPSLVNTRVNTPQTRGFRKGFNLTRTDLNKSHGQLMAGLSFKAKKEEIEVSSFGTEIIKRLQELYYSNKSAGVLKKMSQVMESLGAEFFNEVELEMVMMVVLEVG
ncbi:MAG: hypothetical protein U9Q63_00480, partial [Patescibacteria group bacterium]|nr:hypothetical protein [Patescibacteria group bacterium]